MKKILAMLCLMTLMLAPMGALAAEGDAVIARQGDGIYVDNLFAMGDLLVLTDHSNFYTYQPGDAEMTPYVIEYDASFEEKIGENMSYGNGVAFADGDQLGMLMHLMSYDENGGHLESVLRCSVELTDDGRAVVATLGEADWPDELIEDYGDGNRYPKSFQSPFALNGCLFGVTYGDMGDELWQLNLETMEAERIEAGDNAMAMPYAEGRVLIVARDYGRRMMTFNIYDPATGATELLAEMTDESYSVEGFAANPENGDLYCVSGGEICPLILDGGAFQIGEGLTEMPITVYSNQAGLVFADHYYVYHTYDATVVRNLAPETRPDKKLKVYDAGYNDWLTDAYFDFTNAHGDVAVTISRDYADQQNLIEDMMNRSANVDVYIMDLTYSSYDALRERGFMAELDGSEALKMLTADMYPGVLEKLTRDGQLVAIPVNAYAWPIGVDEIALEKIGLTLADVPTNWSDFLDFLANELPQHLTEESGVQMYYSGITQEDMKQMLFSQILQNYMTHATAMMDVMKFDTELFLSLLDKLERIDFGVYGLPSRAEYDDGAISVYENYHFNNSQLFEFGVGGSFGNFYSQYTPIVMAMDADSPAFFELQMTAAFVNPFSENVDLAIAFLEQIAECVPQEIWYNFKPTLTEPLLRENAEEYIEPAQQYYDQIMAQYEEAEEADKQAMEELLADAEQWLAQAEEDRWLIPQYRIDWFRSVDDHLVVAGNNWLYQDDSGEATELLMQYMQGQIGAKQLVQGIDQKIRMMQMEGY